MRVWVAFLVMTLLFAGCGGQQEASVEEAEQVARSEEAAAEEEPAEPTQAPPRSEEEAAADEAKRKAAQQSAIEYEVAEIRPGTAATDLSQAKAIVYVTSFGGEPYGQFVNGPALQEIADEIRADTPEYEMLVADFYSGTEQRQDRILGSRYSFESPEAEREFLVDLQGLISEE